MLITFEGIGGAGKTTQVGLLAEWLQGNKIDVVATREPGGTEAGESLRVVLLDGAEPLSPRAEAMLFAAARAEDVDEVVRPALARGAVVIADRFVDSSLAYQGVLRGLGVDEVLSLNLFATGGLLPDLTFLLALDVSDAAARRLKTDRVEPSDLDSRLALDRAYRALADRFPDRMRVIDASRPVDDVFRDVRNLVAPVLGLSVAPEGGAR